MRDYYTVDEVAYLCGVSRELVLRWIRNGELKAVLIPNVMKDERYFSGGKLGSENQFIGYAISQEAMDNFCPDMSYRSIQLLNARMKKTRRDEYLDYLDKREKDLYDEIAFISEMKSYIKDIEPYI